MNVSFENPVTTDFFLRDVEEVAKELIGCYLCTDFDGQRTVGRIVETEAYDQDDVAAHCHRNAAENRKKNSDAMLLRGGHIYLYNSRNMACLNFTCGKEGFGSAVLIRALEPILGAEIMLARRREYGPKILKSATCSDIRALRLLCNGPAALCEAIGINFEDIELLNKKKIEGNISIFRGEKPQIAKTIRINVKENNQEPKLRRYIDQNSQFLSRKFYG